MIAARHSGGRSGSSPGDARFGPARTLDLRLAGRPGTGIVERVEPWVRERQIARAGAVRIITGRGLHDPDGPGATRAAVVGLLARLKRTGVVTQSIEPSPGVFDVELAPMTALFDAAPRSRRRDDAAGSATWSDIEALDPEARTDLHATAGLSLARLGAAPTPALVEAEMLRILGVLLKCVDVAETDRTSRLRFLIGAARRSYSDS